MIKISLEMSGTSEYIYAGGIVIKPLKEGEIEDVQTNSSDEQKAPNGQVAVEATSAAAIDGKGEGGFA